MTMRRLQGTLARVGALSLGIWDQAASSLTNFFAIIVVARASTVEEFGFFAIALTTALLLISIVRAVASEPLMVRYSTASMQDQRDAGCIVTGVSLAIGAAVASLISLVALFAFHGTLRAVLIVVALGLPALLIQDTLRFYFFTLSQPGRALLIDALWGACLVATFLIYAVSMEPNPVGFVILWVGTACFSGLVGLWMARLTPLPLQTKAWLHHNRKMIRNYAAEHIVIGSSGHLTLYAVGIVAGPASLGSLKAAQTLYGPLTVVISGLRSILIPRGRRKLQDDSASAVRSMCVRVSIMATAIAVGWGAILTLLPAGLGQVLLGATWEIAAPLILPLMFWKVGSGFGLGAMLQLRIAIALEAGVRARSGAALLLLIGGVLGAFLFEELGAAWGLAIASLMGAQLYWYLANRSSVPRRHIGG